MKISYDKSGDALYIKLTDSEIHKTSEVMDSLMFDLDSDGGVLGIEILYASKRAINPYEILCEYLAEDAALKYKSPDKSPG